MRQLCTCSCEIMCAYMQCLRQDAVSGSAFALVVASSPSFNDTEIFLLVFCFVRSFFQYTTELLYMLRMRVRGHCCVYLRVCVCACMCYTQSKIFNHVFHALYVVLLTSIYAKVMHALTNYKLVINLLIFMHFSLFISRHFDFTLRQNEKLQHQALECCKTYENSSLTLTNTNAHQCNRVWLHHWEIFHYDCGDAHDNLIKLFSIYINIYNENKQNNNG